MKRYRSWLIGVALLGAMLGWPLAGLGCDSHPGVTHEQYVVSIRKKYQSQETGTVDTYSTAIAVPAENTAAPSEREQAPRTGPESTGDAFFDSVGD